jgi:hypothetical protein
MSPALRGPALVRNVVEVPPAVNQGVGGGEPGCRQR